jgi:hypothetical protein
MKLRAAPFTRSSPDEVIPKETPLMRVGKQQRLPAQTLDSSAPPVVEASFNRRPLIFEYSNHPCCSRLPVLTSHRHLEWLKDQQLRDLIWECNMHEESHPFTCRKGRVGQYGCRFGFWRRLVRKSFVTADGRIKLARNDPWVNPFNPWIMLSMRCNHDVRILTSGPDANGSMLYVSDYLATPAVSLKSRATCMSVALKKVDELSRDGKLNDAVARSKQMVLRAINKISAAVERPGAELAAQLLGYPDL